MEKKKKVIFNSAYCSEEKNNILIPINQNLFTFSKRQMKVGNEFDHNSAQCVMEDTYIILLFISDYNTMHFHKRKIFRG